MSVNNFRDRAVLHPIKFTSSTRITFIIIWDRKLSRSPPKIPWDNYGLSCPSPTSQSDIIIVLYRNRFLKRISMWNYWVIGPTWLLFVFDHSWSMTVLKILKRRWGLGTNRTTHFCSAARARRATLTEYFLLSMCHFAF